MSVWILCGLKAAGKSTWAVRLAEALGVPSWDTDAALLEQARVQDGTAYPTVRAVHEAWGEEGFRAAERDLLLERCCARHVAWAQQPEAVWALGGGSLLDAASVEAVRRVGWVIHWAPSLDTVYQRWVTLGLPSGGCLRGLAPGREGFEAYVAARWSGYERASHTVWTDEPCSVPVVVNGLQTRYQRWLGERINQGSDVHGQ